MRTPLLATLMLLALVACAPTSYVVLLENEDGSTGSVIVEGEQGTSTISQAGQGAALDGSSKKPFDVAPETVEKVFGAALAATPRAPVNFMIYFLSDSTRIKPASLGALKKALAAIKERISPDISVIGHADRAGDEIYNHRLALRRANAIADKLLGANVNVTEITVTSHGENNPIVATADDVHEPKNRRVQITVR